MKQIKISDFFAKSREKDGDGHSVSSGNGKRKWSEGKNEEPSSPNLAIKKTRKKSEDINVRKGSNTIGKCQVNKENGLQKLLNVFTVKPLAGTEREKRVLSPKKLDENVSREDNRKRSPEKPKASRDLFVGFEELSFDDSMVNFDCGSQDWCSPLKILNCENLKSDASLDDWESFPSILCLDRAIRCTILKSTFHNQPKCEQLLLVQAEGSEKKSVCHLRDMWTFLTVNIGDTVTIQAIEQDGVWVVNARDGYIILHPDRMTSITSLIGSMYCLRRGILTSLFKGLDSNRKHLIIGRVCHELLQETLRRKLNSEEDILCTLTEILKSKSYLQEIYMADLKLEYILSEVADYVPKILNFVDVYINGVSPPVDVNFQGRIAEVLDIEELVASPRMGIQGRVDLKVRIQSKNGTNIMPLELKTGRASFTREHKTQVILYTLLLDEITRNVNSGLLLYLKDGLMEEIRKEPDEIRNLLILRNEYVKYMRDGNTDLPDPIRSSSCSKCLFSRLCHSYLKHDGWDNLSPSHPLREIDYPDLKQSHVDYFVNWIKLLHCEHESSLSYSLLEFVLEDKVEVVNDKFKYRFRREGSGHVPHSGSYVFIFSSSYLFVGSGQFLEETKDTYSVLLGKKLDDFSSTYHFLETRSTLLSIYLTNMGFLMNEEYERLRQLIIDGASPIFDEKIMKRTLSNDCVDALKSLNREQQRAVLKTVAAKDYLLVRGPPGTGKTEVIVALVKFLYSLNQSILITGHTHSSVDNILVRLKGVDYIRFGSLSSVHEKIHERCYARLIDHCTTMEDIRKLYDHRVMASTCLGLDIDLIFRKKFDVCIMDESSQVLQAEAIRPLLFCRKFVLIGDSKQLPPVVKTLEAKRSGMGVSIFEKLEPHGFSVCLRLQYRMNQIINDLANRMTYGGELECGNDTVANSTLVIPKRKEYEKSPAWVKEALSPDLSMSVVFLDTSDYFKRQEPHQAVSNQSNPVEADIVVRLLHVSREVGIPEENIGIISPFCDQVRLLTESLRHSKVEVNTVDRYQGRDKDVIIFSCSKHFREEVQVNPTHLLSDPRRLTVAITRARVKLIVVGDLNSLLAYDTFKAMIEYLNKGQIIHLKNGEKDFFWNEI